MQKNFILHTLKWFSQHGRGCRQILRGGGGLPFSLKQVLHWKTWWESFFGLLSMFLCCFSSPSGFGFPSCLLWCHVLVTSKKGCFHTFILGFGLGPGFDSEDLRADTVLATSPPPPLSGLRLRPCSLLYRREHEIQCGMGAQGIPGGGLLLFLPTHCLHTRLPHNSPSLVFSLFLAGFSFWCLVCLYCSW